MQKLCIGKHHTMNQQSVKHQCGDLCLCFLNLCLSMSLYSCNDCEHTPCVFNGQPHTETQNVSQNIPVGSDLCGLVQNATACTCLNVNLK